MSGECYETRNHRNADVPGAGEEVLVRSQAVASRTGAGETLIVPVRRKVGDLASIYSFNETGSFDLETSGDSDDVDRDCGRDDTGI